MSIDSSWIDWDEYKRFSERILYGCTKEEMPVEIWLLMPEIAEKDIVAYPNAKAAAELKSSPLYKALE